MRIVLRQPTMTLGVLLSVMVLAACGSNRPVAGETEPYEGTELSGAAPDFSLLDQDARRSSYPSFTAEWSFSHFSTPTAPTSALSPRSTSDLLRRLLGAGRLP